MEEEPIIESKRARLYSEKNMGVGVRAFMKPQKPREWNGPSNVINDDSKLEFFLGDSYYRGRRLTFGSCS